MLAAVGIGAMALTSYAVYRRRNRRHVDRTTAPSEPSRSEEGRNEDLEKMSGDMVAYSSQLIAAWRATESAYGEAALFDDFLAPTLAGPHALKRVEPKKTNNARFSIRTKYFDDWVSEAVRLHGIGQIVLPAAGMDSRAFRLNLEPHVHVYEIDQAVVMKEKSALLKAAHPDLKPTCNRHEVVADLAVPDWSDKLVAAGFRRSEASAWVIEGLLYYLTEQEVEALFKTIRCMVTNDSVLLASIVTKRRIFQDEGQRKDSTNRLQSKFKWFCEDPEGFFGRLGFEVVDNVALGSERANFGRWQADFISNTLYISLKPM